MKRNQLGTVVVLVPSGPLMEGHPLTVLNEAVENELAEGVKDIIIDLAEVPWLNSSGIGTLMGCRNSCRAQGGRLALAAANERILKLLRSLMLHTVFEVYEQADQAVSAWSGDTDQGG